MFLNVILSVSRCGFFFVYACWYSMRLCSLICCIYIFNFSKFWAIISSNTYSLCSFGVISILWMLILQIPFFYFFTFSYLFSYFFILLWFLECPSSWFSRLLTHTSVLFNCTSNPLSIFLNQCICISLSIIDFYKNFFLTHVFNSFLWWYLFCF